MPFMQETRKRAPQSFLMHGYHLGGHGASWAVRTCDEKIVRFSHLGLAATGSGESLGGTRDV